MAGDDDNFLSRWARRKRSQRRRPETESRTPPDAEAAGAGDADASGGDASGGDEEARAQARSEAEAERQRMIEELPDPDTLEEHDDFTQFMQEGVPEDLRGRALRRLWRSNPIYAVRDGLNDYDLDYTDAATVVKNLKTAFQVGRGMVDEETRKAEAEAEAAAARGEAEHPAPGQGAPDAADADAETASADTADAGDREPDGAPGTDPEAADATDAGPSDVEETAPRRPPRRLAVGRRDADAGPPPAGDSAEAADAPRVRGRAARRRWGGSES